MASIGNNSSTVLSYYWNAHPELKEYFLDYPYFYNWMHTPSAAYRTDSDIDKTPWEIFIREDPSFIMEFLGSADVSSLYSARDEGELSDEQLIKHIWLDEYEITWLGPKFNWSFKEFEKWMTTPGILDKILMLPWNIGDGVEFIGMSPIEMCQIDGYIILNIYAEDEEFNKDLWRNQIKERKTLASSGKTEALKYIWEEALWVQEFFENEEKFEKWMIREPVRPKSNFLFRKKILPAIEKKKSSYDLWLKYGYSVLGLLMGRSLVGREDL